MDKEEGELSSEDGELVSSSPATDNTPNRSKHSYQPADKLNAHGTGFQKAIKNKVLNTISFIAMAIHSFILIAVLNLTLTLPFQGFRPLLSLIRN